MFLINQLRKPSTRPRDHNVTVTSGEIGQWDNRDENASDYFWYWQRGTRYMLRRRVIIMPTICYILIQKWQSNLLIYLTREPKVIGIKMIIYSMATKITVAISPCYSRHLNDICWHMNASVNCVIWCMTHYSLTKTYSKMLSANYRRCNVSILGTY